MIIMMVQVYFRLFFSKWPSTIILHFHQPSSSENKQAEAWLNVVEQNKRAIFITQHSSKKKKLSSPSTTTTNKTYAHLRELSMALRF